MSVTGVGEFAGLVETVIEKIWPDKSEIEKQQMAAALAVVQGQIHINKVEASNPSILVSGWRPFIGWVCGTACAWNWIGISMVLFFCKLFGFEVDVQPASLTEMLPILMGMLGLGAMRTHEKKAGVARS